MMYLLLQIHAGLMILTVCLFITIAIIARIMKKKRWWLKAHRSIAITGVTLSLIALLSIAVQIILTERAHLRVPHSWVGLVSFVFVLLTPTVGLLQFKIKNIGAKLRVFHRWSGRTTICLMILNIVLGLLLIGVF